MYGRLYDSDGGDVWRGSALVFLLSVEVLLEADPNEFRFGIF